MRGNRWRHVSLVGAVALLAIVSWEGSPATARSRVRTWKSHGYVYVAKTRTVQGFLESGDAAHCSRGKDVLGGGLDITGDYTATASVGSTEPSGTHNWLAYAQNEGASDQKMTIYAICHKEVPEYAVSTPTTVPSGGQGSASATCPSGLTSVGGGMQIYSGFYSDHVDVNMSIPADGGDAGSVPDDVWLSYGNDRGPRNIPMYSIVICNTALKTYVQTSDQTLAAGTQDSVQALCPAGTVVTSGGAFNDSTSPHTRVTTSRPYDTLDVGSAPDNGWLTTIRNGSAASTTIRGYAVCVSV